MIRLGGLGLAIFVGLELSLRIFQPSSLDYYRKLKLLHVYHPEYLVGLEPGVDYYLRHNNGLWEGRFTINSLGYRGSVEPAPDDTVLGCLGDSLVMGFGVSDEDTFCRRLDGIELSGRRMRTQNLGVDAFGSQGYAARLDEAVHEKLPNLRTVLLFISPNDFTLPQELRDRGILPDDDTDAIRERNPGFKSAFRVQFELTRYFFTLHAASVARQQLIIRRALLEKNMRRELVESGLLEYRPAIDGAIPENERGFRNYLRRSFYRVPTPPVCAPNNAHEAPAPDAAQTSTSTATVTRPNCPQAIPEQVQCQARAPQASDLEPLPEITRRAYERMIRTARENNVRLIIVFLPVQMETLYCEMNGKYSRFFDHAIRAGGFFRSQGIETVDLRPYVGEMCGEALETNAAGEPTRYSGVTDYIIQGDGHLTDAGNRWAARSLVRELKKLAEANAF